MHRRTLAAAGLIVVLTLVSYAPAYRAGYVVDDENYVTGNLTLRDLTGLQRIWLDVGATPQYYPLVYTTFWLEYQIWQQAPLGYHVVNVLLHVANALLLWSILRRLRLPGAWFAAALFALHPVQVESVVWIAERKNVLSGLLYLLSALVYLRYAGLDRRATPSAGRPGWYLLSLMLFCGALLSKTATLSLPAALLLILWWKRERIAWRRDLLPLLPMFAVGLALGMITLRVETTTGGAAGQLWELSWVERALVAGRALWFYAAKLIWPASLSFNYARWTIDPTVWWQYLYPMAALGVVAGLWWSRHELGRGPLVAVLYFAGTLVPTLGFFNVYFFRYAYVADHFQYLAGIGLIALVAGAAGSWVAASPRRLRRTVAVAAGAVLLVAGSLTWRQARAYESLETLCLDTLRKNPTSWLANNNLGNVYMQRGELEAAVARFEVALEAAPTYIETRLNLAIALMNLGRHTEAAQYARSAIELRPQNKFGYSTLADVYARAGRPGDAIAWYRQALDRDPEFVKAQLGLAVALTRSGSAERAVELFEAALRSEPDNVAARGNLAIALAELGRLDEAVGQFEEALRFDPANATLRQNLALARQKAAAARSSPAPTR